MESNGGGRQVGRIGGREAVLLALLLAAMGHRVSNQVVIHSRRNSPTVREKRTRTVKKKRKKEKTWRKKKKEKKDFRDSATFVGERMGFLGGISEYSRDGWWHSNSFIGAAV